MEIVAFVGGLVVGFFGGCVYVINHAFPSTNDFPGDPCEERIMPVVPTGESGVSRSDDRGR